MQCVTCGEILRPGLRRCPGCGLEFAAPVPAARPVRYRDAATEIKFRELRSRIQIVLAVILLMDFVLIAILSVNIDHMYGTTRTRSGGSSIRAVTEREIFRRALRDIRRL
jgi:hypothetical protein